MSFTTTPTRVSYHGDGTSMSFPVPWLFYANTDLLVILNGIRQTLSSQFNVSGASIGSGAVNFIVAPPNSAIVQIVLDPPITQVANFVDGTAFPSASVNQVNDRAVQLIARLSDRIDRCVRAPDGDDAPQMLLAIAIQRANMFLCTDASGNVVASQSLPPNTAFNASTIGAFLYSRTEAEQTAGITPAFGWIEPLNLLRYGADPKGIADSTTAINAAISVAAIGKKSGCGAEVRAKGGVYLFSSELLMPMGDSFLDGTGSLAVIVRGDGKEQTIFRASATGTFTTAGFNYVGPGSGSYANIGGLKDLTIDGNGVLPLGVAVSYGQMGDLDNLQVRGCIGPGIYMNNVLRTRISQPFVSQCGNSGRAQIEIDGTDAGVVFTGGAQGGSTTIVIDQAWCQNGNAGCVAGLHVDRTNNVLIIAGARESGGFGIQIASKASTVGMDSVIIEGADTEALGGAVAYLTVGLGLSGSNYVTGLVVIGCPGYAPGAASEAVFMQQTLGAVFKANKWGVGASMTSIYNLFGTSNLFTRIEPHPALNNPASTVPYVIVNGSQVRTANPLVTWEQAASPSAPLKQSKTLTTTWTPWAQGDSVNQGGWNDTLIAGNSTDFGVPSMPGDPNMVVLIIGDGHSTLTQGTSGDKFDNITAGNFLLLAHHAYLYRYDSSRGCWRQLGTA